MYVYHLFDYVCYTTFVMKNNNFKEDFIFGAIEVIKKIVAIAFVAFVLTLMCGVGSIIAVGVGKVLPEWMVFTFYFAVYTIQAVVFGLAVAAVFGIIYGIFRVLEHKAHRIARKMKPEYRRNWRRYEFICMVVANCIGLLFAAVGKGFKLIGACIDVLN